MYFNKLTSKAVRDMTRHDILFIMFSVFKTFTMNTFLKWALF